MTNRIRHTEPAFGGENHGRARAELGSALLAVLLVSRSSVLACGGRDGLLCLYRARLACASCRRRIQEHPRCRMPLHARLARHSGRCPRRCARTCPSTAVTLRCGGHGFFEVVGRVPVSISKHLHRVSHDAAVQVAQGVPRRRFVLDVAQDVRRPDPQLVCSRPRVPGEAPTRPRSGKVRPHELLSGATAGRRPKHTRPSLSRRHPTTSAR